MADDVEKPAARDAGDTPARTFLPRTLATISALFSVVATVAGVVSGYYAEEANRRAQDNANTLARMTLNKDYQVHVFDMVDKALSMKSGGLVLAAAYAKSVDDTQVQQALTEAIRVVAQARDQSGDHLTDAEKQAFQLLKQDVQTASQAPDAADAQTLVVEAPNSAVGGAADRVVNTDPDPLGWDIDVFWCESRGAPSQTAATAVANALSSIAETPRGQVAGERLGRVRLRKLSRASASGGGFPDQANTVRADSGKTDLAGGVQAVANAALAAGADRFTVSASKSHIKWYLSVFACGRES
jgi:hypothetical protein